MRAPSPNYIKKIYLSLLLFSTLASSLIWGVNTLFLLEAGLSNTEAFLANAFFMVGQVLFEVPTGMVADMKGRRLSYLLGTVTLAVSTLLYLGAWYIQAPLVVWAFSSVILGLGFTFFSGATEAWLVDALEMAQYRGKLETFFAQGQIVSGTAMLIGSVTGGFLAQLINIRAPYILRAVLLLITLVVAYVFMKDWGFKPRAKTRLSQDLQELFTTSMKFGWSNPAVRWTMAAAPFLSGVSFYAFYAMQPHLLALYQDETAYSVAGLAAAIVAGSQIVGGMSVPYLSQVAKLRTTVLLFGSVMSVAILFLVGITTHFWLAIALLSAWGLVSAATQPVRQAYLNGLIPSKQRATVLSFDSLVGSSGGVVIQPVLGRVADLWSYGASFMVGSLIQSAAVPFIYLARSEKVESDKI